MRNNCAAVQGSNLSMRLILCSSDVPVLNYADVVAMNNLVSNNDNLDNLSLMLKNLRKLPRTGLVFTSLIQEF